jgi:hypothetical protein
VQALVYSYGVLKFVLIVHAIPLERKLWYVQKSEKKQEKQKDMEQEVGRLYIGSLLFSLFC